jgi:hypothetical protein
MCYFAIAIVAGKQYQLGTALAAHTYLAAQNNLRSGNAIDWAADCSSKSKSKAKPYNKSFWDGNSSKAASSCVCTHLP